jgi:anti-anti-sigma regulatory factor
MKFYLIVAKGKQKGTPIPVSVDLFMIGSSKACQLRSKVRGVAEEHCMLVTRERKAFIRDMNGGEPTLVNGSVLSPGEEWPLHAGDRIEVGPFEFMVQMREKPLSQRDLEEWAATCLDTTLEQELFDEGADEFHKATTASAAAASILDILQAKRGIVRGRLRIGRDSGVIVVRFNDRFLVEEGEIALVKKELCDNLNQPNLRVLLDLKNVKRMSTAAVTMLGEMYKWLRSWGSRLALCRVRGELQGILTTMSMEERLPLFHDKRSALAAKW